MIRPRALAALVAMVAGVAFVGVSGQVKTDTTGAGQPAKNWTPTRTADGQPDLQGVWTNYTTTPFEVFHETDKPGLYAGDPDGRDRGTGPEAFPTDSTGRKLEKRRSLVVDPPDGRVPVMPWAEAKRNYALGHTRDSWIYQTTWERCITRGVPGGIFPTAYGAGYKIVQAPGVVLIYYEMIHEARVIPLDGRPHLGLPFRNWNGDSRGRWEGNTLVVDITNYNDKGSVATNVATQRIRAIPQSEELHVVERFTRVDENTINYEARIEDPKVFTAPWTVAMPLTREPGYQIYEYACHEDNQAMPHTLSAGRALDKARAAAK